MPSLLFFFSVDGHHRDLHVLTHPFPTRRSSDLNAARLKAERHRLPRRGRYAMLRELRFCPLSPRSPAAVRQRRGVSSFRGACHAALPSPASIRSKATRGIRIRRSEEHTSELQSLMRISYAVFCLKQKKKQTSKTCT